MNYAVVILAALVLVLGVQALGRADAPTGVQRWEFKEVSVPPNEIEKVINPLGAEGWELVLKSDGHSTFYFKRPLK